MPTPAKQSASVAEKTAAEETTNSQRAEPAGSLLVSTGCFLSLFALVYTAFYITNKKLPYLKLGSEVIYEAKLEYERKNLLFPKSHDSLRVLAFGTSKTLAGFVPSVFDNLAAQQGLKISSFNSGYPARREFLSELEQITSTSNGPDLVLLTVEPTEPPSSNLFHFVSDDHEIASTLFPFRTLLRDTLSFLMTSREHGGPVAFYRQSEKNVSQMIVDSGYYFISEQSHFSNDRLPESFTIQSDDPQKARPRSIKAQNSELRRLKTILKKYNIACFYIPSYARIPEAAKAPDRNEEFAQAIKDGSSCEALGPDYYQLPNRYFSDQTHLNRTGAVVYTRMIWAQISADLVALYRTRHAF